MVKRIITYGTFDLFHFGHVRLLKRLRDLGDELYVGCATDEFNLIKGKSAIIPYEERAEVLASCRYVDAIFPETSWHQKQTDIQRYKIDIFGMGDDWKGKFDDLSKLCQVIYLTRTDEISTTNVISQVQRRQNQPVVE